MSKLPLTRKIIQKDLSFGTVTLELIPLGDDLQILLYGGDKPHIGCTVLATPRPSLTGDGSVSATASVLNAIGHKDDALCRYLAETYAARYETTVVCSGGVHVDNITPDQIKEVLDAVKQ